MLKLYFTLLPLLMSSISLFSQAWEWASGHGTSGSNSVHSIATTAEGDIIASGIIMDTTIFGNDTLYTNGLNTLGYLVKFKPDGHPIWAKPLFIQDAVPPQSFAYPINISVASNNDILLSSHFKDTLILGNDTLYESNGEMFITRLDSLGNVLWAQNFGDINPLGTNLVSLGGNDVDIKDNIYLIGTFNDIAYFQTDTLTWQQGRIFILKFDQNGNEKWVRQCGNQLGGWQRGYGFSIDSSSNIYLTGTVSSGPAVFGLDNFDIPSGRNSTYLTKLDSTGVFKWTVIGGGLNDFTGGGQIIPSTYGTSVATDGSQNVYFTGFFADTVQFGDNLYYPNCGNPYCINFFLASYDIDGSFNWFVQPSFISQEPGSLGMDVEVDDEGKIYILGGFNDEISFDGLSVVSSEEITGNDLFFAKFEEDGTCIGLLHSNTHTRDAKMTISCLNQSVIIGSNYDGVSGNLDTFGVEFSSNQNIFFGAVSNTIDCGAVSSIVEQSISEPILHIYPNPFDDFLQISLNKTDFNKKYEIDLFNALGQLVYSTLVSNTVQTINIAPLQPGLYFIQVYDEKGKKIGSTEKIIKRN